MDLTFPLYINLGIVNIHPHVFFEMLGWIAGLSLMFFLRREKDDFTIEQRSWLILAAVVGAIFGAKLLAWIQHADHTIDALYNNPAMLIGGKTMVGGLLGGLIGVETSKKMLGITQSTGDVYVYPLIVSISIGRVGCFFSGLEDATYGISSNFFWAVDFGDGVTRHPTQIYEIIFLTILGISIYTYSKNNTEMIEGGMFKLFMIGYLSWRLIIDGLKPADFELIFLTPIQWACIGGLVYYRWQYLVSWIKPSQI